MSRKTSYNKKMKVRRLKLSAQDEVGGIVSTKITIYQVACRIRQLKAKEQGLGGKNGVVSTHRIYCRNIDITSGDDIVLDNQIYDINSINHGSANKGSIEIDCTLRV